MSLERVGNFAWEVKEIMFIDVNPAQICVMFRTGIGVTRFAGDPDYSPLLKLFKKIPEAEVE